MGWLDTIRSLLNIDSGGRTEYADEEVTLQTSTESAVKTEPEPDEPDAPDEPDEPDEEEAQADEEPESEPERSEETEPSDESESTEPEETETSAAVAEESDEGDVESSETVPLTDIKGIGDAYADRLKRAGVEDIAGLAGADVETLSEETGISEKRLGRWIDRASER